MYSVPFDYNWYSNWFDVWLYSGKRRANYNLWYQMYYDNPFEGDNYWHERNLGSRLRSSHHRNSQTEAVNSLLSLVNFICKVSFLKNITVSLQKFKWGNQCDETF